MHTSTAAGSTTPAKITLIRGITTNKAATYQHEQRQQLNVRASSIKSTYSLCSSSSAMASASPASSSASSSSAPSFGTASTLLASSASLLLSKFAMLKLLWIAKVALMLLPLQPVAAGSCREAQLCCGGRDSSCVVQKAPINAIIEDLSDKPCYCDHACLKLGDCCDDFKDHCGVLDCQVSDWGQWSECDKSCGTGMMSRTRKVLQPAQNGGKHCPSLVQKRGCQGFLCHGHHDKKILREMALLLPAALSRNRHVNESTDIRRNLRVRYHDSYKHNREQEYCVEFEVLKASKACHKLPPYNLMSEGDRITVRCDLEALIQDPNEKVDPKAAQSSKRLTTIANTADVAGEDKEEDEDDDAENMLDSESDEYDPSAMRSGTLLTAPTGPQSTASTTTTTKAPIRYHCRGEGLAGRTTRWSALPAPSCRGKWLRLSVGEPKKCTHSQFIFV